MLFLSLLLLILWLGSLAADLTMGGLVHLLALSALTIVLVRGDRHPRHPRGPRHA